MVIFGPPFTDDGAYNLICTTLNLVWFWTSLNGKKSGSLCWSWHPRSHGILPMRVATLQVRAAMALPTILPLLVSLSCSVKVCIIQLDHISLKKIFVDFLTSTLLHAQNTTLLPKVRQRFFQILWPSQKTQTLRKSTYSSTNIMMHSNEFLMGVGTKQMLLFKCSIACNDVQLGSSCGSF